MKTTYYLLIPYLIVSAANLYFVKSEHRKGMAATKLLLMPALALFYIFNTGSFSILAFAALFFAFLGDGLLLKEKLFFIVGVVNFLICHLMYSLLFIKTIEFSAIPLWFYIMAIPYFLYGVIILKALLPYVNLSKALIIAYLIIILSTCFFSLNRAWNTTGAAFWLPFYGTLLFIVSDTILAFNSFRKKIRNGGIYIMTTYLAAQFLIICGLL